MNNILHNLRHSLVKSTNQLFSIAIVFLLTLSSCSKSEDTVSQPKLLSKLVEVVADNSTTTTTFTYEGSKIVSTDAVDKHATYIYTNDLITQIVVLDKATQLQSVLLYNYTNGVLEKVVSSDNYVMTFTHNDDSTVSYEKHTTDINNNVITLYSGKMSFQNGDLIKDERTLGGTAANIVSKNIVTYQYDAKTNPLQNIVGYSK
jgi:Zn/Cd-binding protein ZinT